MANAYTEEGDIYNALSNYNKALKIWQKTVGEESAEVADLYAARAMAHSAIEDYDAALEDLGNALATDSLLFGGVSQKVADCYLSIAGVFNAGGDAQKALEYYGKALGVEKGFTARIIPW